MTTTRNDIDRLISTSAQLRIARRDWCEEMIGQIKQMIIDIDPHAFGVLIGDDAFDLIVDLITEAGDKISDTDLDEVKSIIDDRFDLGMSD